MMKYRIFAALIAPAAVLAISASPARAQGPVAIATAAAPIISQVISSVSAKPKPQGNWLKAEVIHADSNTIVVREQANGMMIHTFNFAPELKDKMQAILDHGGFQYGDKVSILNLPGQTVALKIHGKPSKPL
jgi:hypothetical protein